MHGYGIVLHVQRASDEAAGGRGRLAVSGAAPHGAERLDQVHWALTESGRKAKYYRLTPAGRRELEEAEKSFEQLVKGVRAVMRYA